MSKDDVEYVLERIESTLRLLETRTDSESVQAIVELNLFRSSWQSDLAAVSTPMKSDIETAFYELLGKHRILGLAFLDAMEGDVRQLARDRTPGGQDGPRTYGPSSEPTPQDQRA